jgi:NAD(P)-dependent dehydrogenase (short-subunit alcohol dehydrogenase family)
MPNNEFEWSRPTLAGRGIVITGAASGIGRATSLLAAGHGARLLLADRDEQPLQALADELAQAGAEVEVLALELATKEATDRLLTAASNALGRVDGAVCAAGINRVATALEISPEQWDEVISNNLSGTFFTMQALARTMSEGDTGGSLVVLSSGAATSGFPGLGSYAASKAGLIALVKCFALDLAPKVRINAIAPGPTDTPMMRSHLSEEEIQGMAKAMIPFGRPGEAEEIATVARFLLSDESSYITGQTLHVNGGMFLAS